MGVPRHIAEAAAHQEGVDMQAVDDECTKRSSEAGGGGELRQPGAA